MAEIRKPVGAGSGILVPNSARRGPSAGRRGTTGTRDAQGPSSGAAAETLTEHHGEPQDTLQQDHGRSNDGGHGSLAAQGQKAAMQQPSGLSARAAVGPRGMTLRPSALQMPVRSASLQDAREHAPAVLKAALSHLNSLAQPAALAPNGAPAGRQEALREMNKLLRQAALQHGFNAAEAQSFKALAEQAGVADHPKVAAAALHLRPTTPGLEAHANPFTVMGSIVESKEEQRRASEAASQEAEREAAAARAALSYAVQNKDSSKRSEAAESFEAKHADDARAKVQEARVQAYKWAPTLADAAAAVGQSAEEDPTKRKP